MFTLDESFKQIHYHIFIILSEYIKESVGKTLVNKKEEFLATSYISCDLINRDVIFHNATVIIWIWSLFPLISGIVNLIVHCYVVT